MARPVYRQRWAWVSGLSQFRQAGLPGIECADLALSALADRGLLTTRWLADFQDDTGLADLSWRMFWSRSALDDAGGNFRSLLRRTHGFVIFIHGWCSQGASWDPLPALICAANPRLIALVPDLNSFGGTPFLAEVPALDLCHPGAIMRSIVHWATLLGLRSGPQARRRRVITFVGHSVGGAALFFFDAADSGWGEVEYARCAIAPTLLLTDQLRTAFYGALGANGWINKPFDERKTRLTWPVVERMLAGVGEEARREHRHIFEQTPKGMLSQTFAAIGMRSGHLDAGRWPNLRVILGHDDALLNVSAMLELLDDLGLRSNQVQVVRGGHYLLSTGEQNRRIHLRNRETVVGEILYLHEVCREQQRSGH